MESETNEQETGSPAAKKAILPLLAALFGAAAVGGAVGGLLTGPVVAEAMYAGPHGDEAEPAADATVSAETEEGAQDEKGGPIYVFDNLVLNPAGSSGMRFLMASLALEARDEEIMERLSERDAAVRDKLLSVLGSKTVEELASTTQRDSLKQELLMTTSQILGPGAVRRVYFPQFVIQ